MSDDQHDPTNWVLTHQHPTQTIFASETTYSAIHRITNESQVVVTVQTAGRARFDLAQNSSLDISSSSVTLSVPGGLGLQQEARGQYQLLCCCCCSSPALQLAPGIPIPAASGFPSTE
jgi:hypothetical protein